MTDEERQHTMDFIVEQQAQFFSGLQKLEESQLRLEESQIRAENRMNRADGRIDRLERIVKLMIKAGSRARRHMREQDERFERRFAALMEAQAHTDRRLDALIEIVREQRNGRS
jgi:hypothetical protein